MYYYMRFFPAVEKMPLASSGYATAQEDFKQSSKETPQRLVVGFFVAVPPFHVVGVESFVYGSV
jgi:hypothetical protein